MDALIFDGSLRFVTDYPNPVCPPGEAVIRPHLVGICNTDWEITRGYMGFHGVLGHEFVGTVEVCEDECWIGKRVVGEINAACFRCPTCLRGDVPHCPNRTTLGIDRRNGAMAEYFSLPIGCLLEVPENVSDRAAVFVEPLAAAVEIVEQQTIRPTERVAVVGDGKLGAMIVQVLRLTGCDLTLIGRHPERWSLFERQGITCALAEAVTEQNFDVVIDCTGQPRGFETARGLLRPRGRLILKSTFAAAVSLDISRFVVDEIALIGSRCGPFAPALRLLERGLIETEALISGCYPLREGIAAFAASTGRMKMLLQP